MLDCLCLDIGGTVAKMGLFVDGALAAEANISVSDNQSLARVLAELTPQVKRWLDTMKVKEVGGVGLALAGLVDSKTQRMSMTNGKYLDGPEVDISSWCQQHFSCPLAVENDARLACLGEWKYGAGGDDMVMVTLGTGVGTSAVIRGRLLRGRHDQAGVLGGHIVLNINGQECNCGGRGCAEAEAASWNLFRIVQRESADQPSFCAQHPQLDFRQLFLLAHQGDPTACRIRDFCLKNWATTLLNLVHAYDADKVVVGGGVMQGYPSLLLAYFQRHLDQFAWSPHHHIEVVASRHPNTAALWGLHYMLTGDDREKIFL